MANELPSLDGSPPRNVAVVMIHDEIMADGEASSGKNAKVKASQVALEQLRDIAPFEFRMQYRCNCHAGGEKGEDTPGEAVGSAI
jgi:endoribonuclease Dicer